MSRHKSFAKIWLAYWLVKPMVPCRKFLGRAKTHDSGARPPSDRAQPSGRTLTCKGSDLADWAASHPPASLRPTEPAGAPSRLGVRRTPAREARSEPGRVATLTSPSTRRAPAAVQANSMPPWLPIAHAITNVTREPKGKGSATRLAALKNTKAWGWAHFGSTAETLHTIGRYSC